MARPCPPLSVSSLSMWRIKHEWTEYGERERERECMMVQMERQGTETRGENMNRERRAQRKLCARYCHGDEERQPVVGTHARMRARACTARNVDTVKVQ